MKKLAIIGASYLQEPLVRRAKEMGIYTVCFAWADGATCAEICDKFYDISIVEKEEILKVCQAEQIDGIATIASDVAAPTVAFVAEQMRLVGNTYESAVRANNKYLMRNAFVDAGISCPHYTFITRTDSSILSNSNIAHTAQFPLIVKPTDRSGSLGVTKVETLDALLPAIESAMQVSFKKEVLVEEFIAGREISVEFISYKGKHYPLQITDKVTTEAPHFVELAHHQPAELSSQQYEYVYSITEKALNALGITNGASHSEYRITQDGRMVVMEIGGRMGGDFIGSDLVRLSTGYDFVKGVIDVALGQFQEPAKTYQCCSGVYFLCEETRHLFPIIKQWQDIPSVIEGKITDNELHSVEKSADRSGYLIYQGAEKLQL